VDKSRGILVIGVILFAILLTITYVTPLVSVEGYSFVRFWLLHYPHTNVNNPILAPPTFINVLSSKNMHSLEIFISSILTCFHMAPTM